MGFFDTFITNIFFLSDKQSDELERILFEIVEIIASFFDNVKEVDIVTKAQSGFFDRLQKTPSISDEKTKLSHLDNFIDIIKSSILEKYSNKTLASKSDLGTIVENSKEIFKKFLSNHSSTEYREESPKNLTIILQCWRPFDDVFQNGCSHNEELKEVVRYLKSVEEEFNLVSISVNSTYLSRDFAYNRVGLQHMVPKKLTDLLDTNGKNKTKIIERIKEELLKMGNVTKGSADSLLNSHLDVNRLNFINFRINEEVS